MRTLELECKISVYVEDLIERSRFFWIVPNRCIVLRGVVKG